MSKQDDELRTIIVKATSLMLDNPDTLGIYPTTDFFDRMENELGNYISTHYIAKAEVLRALDTGQYIDPSKSKQEVVDAFRESLKQALGLTSKESGE